MSKQHDIPDYQTWVRDDLITETTRQAFVIDAEDQAGNATKALLARERYHLAMAALTGMTTPFDPAAAQRAERTRDSHVRQAESCRAERLGLVEEVPA